MLIASNMSCVPVPVTSCSRTLMPAMLIREDALTCISYGSTLFEKMPIAVSGAGPGDERSYFVDLIWRGMTAY